MSNKRSHSMYIVGRTDRTLSTPLLAPCFCLVLFSAGPIPKELGALADLQQLRLYGNQLTGKRQGINVAYDFPPTSGDTRFYITCASNREILEAWLGKSFKRPMLMGHES